MNDARPLMIAAAAAALLLAAGCSTNAPYEPTDRATVGASTQPALTTGVDRSVAPAAIAEAQPPLAQNVAIPPAPQPTATQPSPAGDVTATRRSHVVAKGETLYSISKQYYGTGAEWKAIGDANPGIAPERLPVGKTIVIP